MPIAFAVNLTCFVLCAAGATGQVDFMVGVDKSSLIIAAALFGWAAIQIAYHKDNY